MSMTRDLMSSKPSSNTAKRPTGPAPMIKASVLMASDMLLTAMERAASIDVPGGSGKPLRSWAMSRCPYGAARDPFRPANRTERAWPPGCDLKRREVSPLTMLRHHGARAAALRARVLQAQALRARVLREGVLQLRVVLRARVPRARQPRLVQPAHRRSAPPARPAGCRRPTAPERHPPSLLFRHRKRLP